MKLIILAAFLTSSLADAQLSNLRYPADYNRRYFNDYNNYQGPSYRPKSVYEGNAAILRSDSQVNDRGYHYAYETDNGIQAEQSGIENNGIETRGSYSYTGDDGQVYTVRYTAGVDGFRPEAPFLPTPPPIPEAIARSLEANARDEAIGVIDDGSYKGDTVELTRKNQYFNNFRRPFAYNTYRNNGFYNKYNNY